MVSEKKKIRMPSTWKIKQHQKNPIDSSDAVLIYAVKQAPLDRRWEIFNDMGHKEIKEIRNPNTRRLLRKMLPKKGKKK